MGFVGIVCFKAGGETPPLQKIVHWVSDGGVLRVSFIVHGRKTDYTEQTDKSRTAIVRLYGGNCFSARFVRDRVFCGRGGEASDVFLCRTLTQSPTVPALSRREPWFERTICVVRNRIICGYRMLFTGGKTDYTEQTDNCR